MTRSALMFALALSLTACAAPAPAATPPVRHVFVVVLENKNYVETFGANTRAKYFAGDLAKRGQLLTQYYGIGHRSLDNYIAMVSGQGPNPQTQADCQRFTDFIAAPGLDADGQALGHGCVYPARVKTVADQLTSAGLSWKGYMQGMKRPCRHPAINGADETQHAKVGDQYATRHNPFVYFHSIIDTQDCARNDVPLDALPADLAEESNTPNLSFIVPDLCEDGHDEPCVDGRPGGLVSADTWLRNWVPKILASPAFQRDGMLVVTFDEAEGAPPDGDASACCDEPIGPNTPNNGGPIPGPGGGRVGAVVVSPFTQAGSVNATPYNHYALLRTIEDLFGLAHLGFAGRPGLKPFGGDVFARAGSPQPPAPAGAGGGCPARSAPVPTAAAHGGALRARIPGARRLSVRLIAPAGGTAARHRAARGTFTWRPQVAAGVYELRLGRQRIAVRRTASRFSVLGPFSARLPCGALASATLGRPAFGSRLRVRYRLRETARVVVTVRRAGRGVARRATVPGPGAHALRFRGLARGTYRVAVSAGGHRATLVAARP